MELGWCVSLAGFAIFSPFWAHIWVSFLLPPGSNLPLADHISDPNLLPGRAGFPRGLQPNYGFPQYAEVLWNLSFPTSKKSCSLHLLSKAMDSLLRFLKSNEWL